jgi:hypothetical protein
LAFGSAFFMHDIEQWGANMITPGPSGGSRVAAHSAADDRAHDFHQDRTGPLDCELLDLYVAILIAVPLAFFLKSLCF